MPSRSCSHRPGVLAATRICSARSAGSPAMKWMPSTPWVTFSPMPPMRLQITGRLCMNASWITSGEFSHQREGTTTQSTFAISRGTSAGMYGPANVTFGLAALSVWIMYSLMPGGSTSMLAPCRYRYVGCGLLQPRHGLQQDLDALVRADLPEEPDPVPRPVLDRNLMGRLRDATVVLELQPLAGDAPVDVALEQEVARTQELVHVLEVRLDQALAQEEVLRRPVREALVAAPRRGLGGTPTRSSSAPAGRRGGRSAGTRAACRRSVRRAASAGRA